MISRIWRITLRKTSGPNMPMFFEQEVKEILQNLGDRFNQYPGTGIFYRGSEIRKIVMRPSLIFFVVLEDGVHALRALRQERNWSKILRTETNYTY